MATSLHQIWSANTAPPSLTLAINSSVTCIIYNYKFFNPYMNSAMRKRDKYTLFFCKSSSARVQLFISSPTDSKNITRPKTQPSLKKYDFKVGLLRKEGIIPSSLKVFLFFQLQKWETNTKLLECVPNDWISNFTNPNMFWLRPEQWNLCWKCFCC